MSFNPGQQAAQQAMWASQQAAQQAMRDSQRAMQSHQNFAHRQHYTGGRVGVGRIIGVIVVLVFFAIFIGFVGIIASSR